MTDKEIQDAIASSIATALKPISDAVTPLAKSVEELSKKQKVLADTYTADKKAGDDAAKAAAAAAKATADPAKGKPGESPTPLTAEQVSKMTADAITKALGDRDAAAQSSAARDAFKSEKLKGLPAAYQDKLGSDPAKWAEQEAAIREGFKKDMESLGLKVPAVGGTPGGFGTGASLNANQATPASLAGADLTPGQAKLAAGLVLPATR